MTMWRFPYDDTKPVFTASDQLRGRHRGRYPQLPQTAIVFFMGKGIDYLVKNHDAEELPEPFPSFLNQRPVWRFSRLPICFLHGGHGAPQAADTIETLAALGVKKTIAVGLFGAFSPLVQPGEIVIPEKAFVEEGTSLHYYTSIEAAAPDSALHRAASSLLKKSAYPIVSTDAVYRQTFLKERLWREKGAVGVDMETSAVFSVSQYLGVKAAALLMASDLHPLEPEAPKWEWLASREMRDSLTEQSVALAKHTLE